MRLGNVVIKVLRKEASKRAFNGSLLILGKRDELCEESFFQSLGFSRVTHLDPSELDLDQDHLSQKFKGSFDLILDFSALEHVFHLPNALRNIWKMLRDEGRIIHLLASANHVDHGFYMFSPSLFWEFYHVNQFQNHSMQILRETNKKRTPWEVYDYEPGCLGRISFGGLDHKRYIVSCIAQKSSNSTGHIIPQQQEYEMKNCKTVKYQNLKRNSEKFPKFYKLFKGIAKKMLMGPLGLKLSARY